MAIITLINLRRPRPAPSLARKNVRNAAREGLAGLLFVSRASGLGAGYLVCAPTFWNLISFTAPRRRVFIWLGTFAPRAGRPRVAELGNRQSTYQSRSESRPDGFLQP